MVIIEYDGKKLKHEMCEWTSEEDPELAEFLNGYPRYGSQRSFGYQLDPELAEAQAVIEEAEELGSVARILEHVPSRDTSRYDPKMTY